MNTMLICPKCEQESCEIISELDLSDPDHDEYCIQLVKCDECNCTIVGWYEESRRGSLDHESSHHFGRFVSQQTWKRLFDKFELCKKPNNKYCHCKAHTWLNGANRGHDFAKLVEPSDDGIDDISQITFRLRPVPWRPKVVVEEPCDYVGRRWLDKQLDESQDWWNRFFRYFHRKGTGAG